MVKHCNNSAVALPDHERDTEVACKLIKMAQIIFGNFSAPVQLLNFRARTKNVINLNVKVTSRDLTAVFGTFRISSQRSV